MKRFIDLRSTDCQERFAFYCTQTNRFETFDDRNTWDTWQEFKEDFFAQRQLTPGEDIIARFKRYWGLMPDWVKEDAPEPVDLSVGFFVHEAKFDSNGDGFNLGFLKSAISSAMEKMPIELQPPFDDEIRVSFSFDSGNVYMRYSWEV